MQLINYYYYLSGSAAQRGLWPPLLWTSDQLVAETST
jgi:hypothetical protein